jgi:hypothetical protein
MQIRALPRLEAERAALENTIVDYLNAIHPDTDPSRCAWCGQPEAPGAVLLPFGVSTHAWLHPDCWAPWREERRVKAIAELAAMKIEAP